MWTASFQSQLEKEVNTAFNFLTLIWMGAFKWQRLASPKEREKMLYMTTVTAVISWWSHLFMWQFIHCCCFHNVTLSKYKKTKKSEVILWWLSDNILWDIFLSFFIFLCCTRRVFVSQGICKQIHFSCEKSYVFF